MKAQTIALSILIYSCTSSNDCEIDAFFKTQFDNSVKIAEVRSRADPLAELVDMGDISRAIQCLETLTGTESKIIWEMCRLWFLYGRVGFCSRSKDMA